MGVASRWRHNHTQRNLTCSRMLSVRSEGASSDLASERRDELDLDAGIARKTRGLDRGARGARRVEVLRVDLVHRREVVQSVGRTNAILADRAPWRVGFGRDCRVRRAAVAAFRG